MRRQGCFAAATPVDDADHRAHEDESRSPQLSHD